MKRGVLFLVAGHEEDVGAVGAGEAHLALVELGGLGGGPAVAALEIDDVGDGAVVAAVAGTGNAGVYFLLDEVALALAADAEAGLGGVHGVDVIYARHRIGIHG